MGPLHPLDAEERRLIQDAEAVRGDERRQDGDRDERPSPETDAAGRREEDGDR